MFVGVLGVIIFFAQKRDKNSPRLVLQLKQKHIFLEKNFLLNKKKLTDLKIQSFHIFRTLVKVSYRCLGETTKNIEYPPRPDSFKTKQTIIVLDRSA